MHPEVELLCDPAHFGERVDRAGHHRTSVCHHTKWQMASLEIFIDFGDEIIDTDFETFINSHDSHVLPADTQQCSSFGDGVVRLFRDIDPHLLRKGSYTFAQKFFRRLGPACRRQCGQICHRAAADE